MGFDKEWEVEATIEIRTSFFCDTKEEAEKEAHKYLSELCQGLYLDCCSNSYEIENIYSYTEDEPQESEEEMKPIIYVYTDSYFDAKRLFNTLYRPCIDKEILCTKALWDDGEYLEIERNTEVWRILKMINPQESGVKE